MARQKTRNDVEMQDKDRRSESRRARHGRRFSETDFSMNSTSTDSTRPTVHTKRAMTCLGTPEEQVMINKDKEGLRQRVPGGAAAKLMLRGPKESVSSDDQYSCTGSVDDGPIDTSEIFELMNKAKEEFDRGYKNDETDDGSHFASVTMIGEEEIEVKFQLESTSSEEGQKETIPSVLNRKEAYHENASVAVAALLNPSLASGVSISVMSESVFQSDSKPRAPSHSKFQSPKEGRIASDGSEGLISLAAISDGPNKNPTTEPLISQETEERLDTMSQRMLDPSKTLSDLLKSIASPDDDVLMDRAYMVRRKNACGALKVLTAHNRKRKQICWTVGVLPALTAVLQDAGERPLEIIYPDVRIRVEYEEARRRAIAALTNLAMPVPNRLAVFHTPGLVQVLISNVAKEDGECLEGSCAILAYLAKSQENRILMAQVPGLFHAVLRVLKPDAGENDPSPKPESPLSEEESGTDDESSVSTTSRSMFSDSTGMTSYRDSFEEDDSFEDGMTTDGDSTTASEASFHSSMSESSGDDSGSGCRMAKDRKTRVKGTDKPTITAQALVSTAFKAKRLRSGYDDDKFVLGARKNLFAMLGHLAKEKDNAYCLARVPGLLPVVVAIARMHESAVHGLAVQLLAQLTRHRLNTKFMVFKLKTVVTAMVKATYSTSEIARRYASYGIQNFSNDKSCRQELASSEQLITGLCKRARHSKDPAERLAAICSLKNLSDEPANLIPLSNTPECIATLMQIAHGQEDGVTEAMQFRACDALATISHWLRKIATNGQAMDALKHGGTKPPGMFVPSLKVVGWSQYK